MSTFTQIAKRVATVATVAALVATGFAADASAAPFSSLSRSADKPAPSATGVTDTYSFTTASNTAIGCIDVVYSLNGDGTGSIPAPFSSSAATVGTAASPFGANVAVDIATSGRVRVTRTSGTVTPGTSWTLAIGALVNGTGTGTDTRYATVTTYATNACSTEVSKGVVGFVYTDGTVISVTVDPTLSFEVLTRNSLCGLQSGSVNAASTASAVDLGRITGSTVGDGGQDLRVTTNAGGGVVVNLSGTNLSGPGGTPFTSADNTAPTAGQSRYNYTVNDTDIANSGQWKAVTTPAPVMTATAGAAVTQCIGFSASASTSTPGGSYSSNITYTAVPTF